MSLASKTTKSNQYNNDLPEIINKPHDGFTFVKLGEIWRFRELLFYLVYRDLQQRYKQTILGVGWVVVNPLITMVVFTFVFGTLINVNTFGIPYPIFAFAALVPWTLFSKGLAQSATSVQTNTGLVTKIYFPRLIMPISSFVNVLLDFLLSLIVLFIMMIGFGFFPTFRMLWIIPFLGLTIMTGMGLSFWFSALQVRMRDINYILPFLLNIMIYITPVAYPSSLVTGNLKFIYGLNPMVTVCDGFRWALLGIDTFSTDTAIVSFITGTLIFISGALFFERSQSSFVDYL